MIREQRAMALIRLAAFAGLLATGSNGDFAAVALIGAWAVGAAALSWYSPNGVRWPAAFLGVDLLSFVAVAAYDGADGVATLLFALFLLANARIVAGRAAEVAASATLLIVLAAVSNWNTTFAALAPAALWGFESTIVLVAGFAFAVFPPARMPIPPQPVSANEIADVMRGVAESVAFATGSNSVSCRWQEPEEPWTYSLERTHLGATLAREPFGTTAPPPGSATVAVWDGGATWILSPNQRLEWHESLPFDVPPRFNRRGCGFSFVRRGATGAVCASLESRPTLDDAMLLGEFSASCDARVDSCFEAVERAREAQRETRLRIARDLHDGPVQTAISAGILARIATASMGTNSPWHEPVSALGDAVDSVSSDLTGLLRELRPETRTRYLDTHLTSRLQVLAANVKRQWGVDVDVELESTEDLPREVRREARRLVEEAVNNAAKHARASQIVVRSAIADDSFELMIRDDGKGFPFHGRFDLATLSSTKGAPRSLVERVNALKGTLVLDSSGEGSTLHIRLPIGGALR